MRWFVTIRARGDLGYVGLSSAFYHLNHRVHRLIHS